MDAFLTDISPEIGYRRRASMEESFVGTVRQLVSTLKRRHGDLLCRLLGEAQSDGRLLKALVDKMDPAPASGGDGVIAEAGTTTNWPPAPTRTR